MYIAKNEIPIKENAPGAVARQKPGFLEMQQDTVK